MSDSEWCRRVEHINWALKFLGIREIKPEAEERLIKEETDLLG